MTSDTFPADDEPVDRITLDARVTDRLLFRTIVGAEPYLAEDIADRGNLPARDIGVGPGYVEFRYEGPLKALEASRLYSSGGPVLAESVAFDLPKLDVVLNRLRQSCRSGVLRNTAAVGQPIRFRIADVGEWRWSLRDALTAHLGWMNDPSDWDVNLELVGGYLVCEVGALHYSRRIRSLRRQAVSTTPVIAAVLCRLAKLTATHRVLDPFCGSGTVLFDATFWTDECVFGADLSPLAVAYATENLSGRGGRVVVSDARQCPLRPASIDRVISNLPFGKKVGSHADNTRLYPVFLREVERLLVPTGRVVLLTEDKRVLRAAVEKSSLKVLRERVLHSGGATPSAFVLGFKRPKRGGGGPR